MLSWCPRTRHCRSSTARMAKVIPQRAEVMAPSRARSARKPASALATAGRHVLVAKAARARSLEGPPVYSPTSPARGRCSLCRLPSTPGTAPSLGLWRCLVGCASCESERRPRSGWLTSRCRDASNCGTTRREKRATLPGPFPAMPMKSGLGPSLHGGPRPQV